jgi:hypothetical protein
MWATKNKTFRADAKSRTSLRVVQPSSYEYLIQMADLIVVKKKPRFLELRDGQATITTFLYEVVGEYAVADFNGLRQVLGPQHKFCVETRPKGGYRGKQPNI